MLTCDVRIAGRRPGQIGGKERRLRCARIPPNGKNVRGGVESVGEVTRPACSDASSRTGPSHGPPLPGLLIGLVAFALLPGPSPLSFARGFFPADPPQPETTFRSPPAWIAARGREGNCSVRSPGADGLAYGS